MLNIAIVIPTYNRLDHLKKLIESIENQILPDDVKIFCIISNSCSTDGTAQYLIDKERTQSQKGSIKFIVQNPGAVLTYVLAKENLKKAVNLVPNQVEWTWMIGDDDYLTSNDVILKLATFLKNSDNSNLDFIHPCQARRSTHTNAAHYGTLFELCNFIGFHEMLGWISSIIMKTPTYKAAFNSFLYENSLSAYVHSAAILGEAANLKGVFLDTAWVDPLEVMQTEDTLQTWQKENVMERYFYVIDDLIFLKERDLLPNKLNTIFFRYLDITFIERYINYVLVELVSNQKLSESTSDHWRRIEKISFLLGDTIESKDFLIRYKSLTANLDNFINLQKLKEHAQQLLVNIINMDVIKYPNTILPVNVIS
jgi:glycosyltransferase involved in cell wall biosynthesis